MTQKKGQDTMNAFPNAVWSLFQDQAMLFFAGILSHFA